MASKGAELSAKDIEELLDTVDSTMDRVKTLYEQYFLGIQKQAPAFLHTDIERKLRDLTQMNLRNTGLRYRLATLQQKFGSYNSYWRRTLRQIENGTYVRNLAKIGRDAARSGADVPEEILAKMPKRMREQVLRDRDQAIAVAKRRKQLEDEAAGLEPDVGDDASPFAAAPPPRDRKTVDGAHILGDDDGDLDFDSLFAAFQDDAPAPGPAQTQAMTRMVPKVPVPVADEPPPPVASGLRTRDDTQPNLPASGPSIVRSPSVPAGPGLTFKSPGATTTAIPRIPAGADPTQLMPRIPFEGDEAAKTTDSIPKTQAMPRVGEGGSTQAMPRIPEGGATQAMPRMPTPVPGQTQAMPRMPTPAPGPTQAMPRTGDAGPTQPMPRMPTPAPGQTQAMPRMPTPPPGPGAPRPPTPPRAPTPAPGQTQAMPRPPVPGPTQAMPRAPTPPPGAKAPAPAPLRPPPGMTEADVNALHAKYVQAKQAVGEKVDAQSREKLLRTIHQTAPKIMEQYKASGVDFTVVVKDNQVVIKAKPKT